MTMLLDLLRDAVRERIDDGTGALVSGGIDSSTVTMLAREVKPDLVTFTGWYDVPGYDEREYANLVAGRNWIQIEITPGDIEEVFDEVARLAPEPIQGPGMVGQYLVARRASKYVGSLLSGEGSDELFGGYARQMIVAQMGRPSGYDDYKLPADYPVNLPDALAYDLERLPDLLAVDDAMCAAFDLEARAPFTDERVVKWALQFSPFNRVGKTLLKQAVRGLVPDRIIQRQDKMGFPIPLQHWAQGPLRQFFMDRIGYLPDKPYDRSWWYDLVESARVKA
jgi:asparagine synthetase B (glutamine-hydrolysing)